MGEKVKNVNIVVGGKVKNVKIVAEKKEYIKKRVCAVFIILNIFLRRQCIFLFSAFFLQT